MNNHLLYSEALKLIEEGIIVVDVEKKIQYINKSVMKFFGVDLDHGSGHPAGCAKPGDIVVLACNYVDLDKEVLSIGDLEIIGVDPEGICKGDALIAMGAIGGAKGSAQIKTKSAGLEERVLEHDFLVDQNLPINVTINEINNLLMIVVNDVSYTMEFQQFDNLLVIIDPVHQRVKFYQTRGYTIRGESASMVLRGGTYLEKGKDKKMLELKGQHINIVKPDLPALRSIEQVLKGDCKEIIGQEYPFLDIYVRLCAYPMHDDNGKIQGCILVLNDITHIKRLQRKIEANILKKSTFKSIVGSSQALLMVKEMAIKVSTSNSTVLLLGESGTGKGIFALGIHENSSRAKKSFIPVNMAAIPASLMESELFGYKEGAFTGASKNGKPGKFVLANMGTIFLDEIGDLDISLQAKLLQILQERRVYPVGSAESVDVDVRVIAATHRNLEEAVSNGTFREDLYYRLNVITLEIPPLRWRKDDIKDLVGHIIPRLNMKVGKKMEGIEPEVYRIFLAYDWPGNVRELENVLESAINLADGRVITVNDLPQRFLKKVKDMPVRSDKDVLSLESATSVAEKHAIEMALSLTNGNRTKAAHMLNIGRTAFYNKLKKYNIQSVHIYKPM